MFSLSNLDKAQFYSDNEYGFPCVPACKFVAVDTWLSFPKRSKVEFYKCTGLHFFCDDLSFNAVWQYPKRYIDTLKKFGAVLMPDFSLYYNIPNVIAMYNKYRNHWLSCYMAFHGCTVIPVFNPGSPECFSWSGSGLPKESVYAFSDIGTSRLRSDRDILKKQFDFLLTFNPIEILYFTRNKNNVPSGCVPVVLNWGDK